MRKDFCFELLSTIQNKFFFNCFKYYATNLSVLIIRGPLNSSTYRVVITSQNISVERIPYN